MRATPMARVLLRSAPYAVAMLFASANVHAQAPAARAATAQALYEDAARAIKAGDYAVACPKLEESQRLDPAMGTQFFLATCYEHTGRPTSAWSLYLEVALAAKAAGNPVRESTARGRAAALEPKLPRITIVVDGVTAALPGVEITRDEMQLKPVVWGSAVPVDLGAHKVRASAPGKVTWEASVTVDAVGKRVVVRVPALAAEAPAPRVKPPVLSAQAPETPPPPQRSMPPQRVAAIATGSVGLAGLVVGGVLAALARSTWSHAERACPTRVACGQATHDESVKALSLATGSTVSFVVGGVGVAGALVLWLTTPKPKTTGVTVAPVVSSGVVGLSAGGAF
jgi:hypothetical protein